MMNKFLRDLINTGKVESFINVIMVKTETEEGHDELVAEILKRLEENDLYVKPEKYKWKVREMEKAKVKAVLDWPVPKLVKDIQKFLGLANYYRRFIEEFVKIARPLHELTRKEQKWD